MQVRNPGQNLVAEEKWIPLDSVGYADGRIVALTWTENEDCVLFEPGLESSLATYLKEHPEGPCYLTETWREESEGEVWVGGEGGFDGDGYVAMYVNGELQWMFFSTLTEPTCGISSLSATAVDVRTRLGILRIPRSEPFRATLQKS